MHLIVKALIVVVCIHAHFCYEKCPKTPNITLRFAQHSSYIIGCVAPVKPERVEWFDVETGKRILKWEEKNDNITIHPDYKGMVVDKEKVRPSQFEEKEKKKTVYVTTLTFHAKDYSFQGRYCCRLNSHGKLPFRVNTIMVKIYGIYIEVKQCSDYQNVLLECRTYKMDVKVLDVNFYGVFNKNNVQKEKKLKKEIFLKSIQKNKTQQIYDYHAKMTIPISDLREGINLKAKCKFVVEQCKPGEQCPRKTTLGSIINSPDKDRRNKVTCLPNVRMNETQLWGKAGNDSVKMYCTFDVPFEDQTESINWYHLNFSTERPISFWKKGNRIVTDEKYKSVIDTQDMKPSNFSDRQATALGIMKRLNLSGIYRCDVEFRDARIQSAEANFLVYQIKQREFTAVGCTEGNVRLECQAWNVDPKPVGVVFTVQNNIRPTHLDLNYIGPPNISKAQGSYYVYATMITPYSQILEIANYYIEKFWCHIVFKRDPEIKESYKPPNGFEDLQKKKKIHFCYPEVVIEKHPRWVKAGSDPFKMTCKFDIKSYLETIESIQWFHNNSMNAFYMWNKNTNRETTLGGYKVTGSNIREKSYLTFEQVRNEYSGHYTCQVTYRMAGNRSSNESSLVVYQIDPYHFAAIGCKFDVRLQCKARNTYPKPLGVVFSVYNPTNDAKLRLNNKVSVEVLKENGAHNIIATIDPIDQLTSLDASSKFECQVVLSRDPEILGSIWTTRKTSVIDNRGRSRDVCFPKVEVDPPLKWAKVGMESLILRCKFKHPLFDRIHSVRWVHRNISEMATDLKHDELTSTFDDSEETSDIIKKIERVAFEHSGRYSCEVNFRFAGKHRGHSVLVVYQIEEPYYFEAERYGDDEITLECRAANLFPKPVDIVFSEYDTQTELKSVLNTEVLPETIEVGGFFNIIANVTIYESRPESVHYACDVVLSKDPEVLATSFTSLPPINLLEEQAKPNKTDDKGSSDIPIAVFIAVSAAGAILVARLA